MTVSMSTYPVGKMFEGIGRVFGVLTCFLWIIVLQNTQADEPPPPPPAQSQKKASTSPLFKFRIHRGDPMGNPVGDPTGSHLNSVSKTWDEKPKWKFQYGDDGNHVPSKDSYD